MAIPEGQAAGAAMRDELAARTRIINDTAGEIRALLKQVAASIKATLLGQPSDYEQWYLPQLQAEIERALKAAAGDAAAAVDAGMVSAIDGGRALVDRPLAAGLPELRLALPVIQVPQLEAMRAFATSKIGGITLAAADQINTQLGLVMIGGQTPHAAVEAVTALLEEETTRRGVTIVHTQLAQAYSTANQARMDQAVAEVPGLKKKWLKSGKLHPRANHDAIHGQIRPAAGKFDLVTAKGEPLQMAHPHDPTAPAGEIINCGCVAVPVVPGWESTLPGTAD
jgi:hypothetical protein